MVMFTLRSKFQARVLLPLSSTRLLTTQDSHLRRRGHATTRLTLSLKPIRARKSSNYAIKRDRREASAFK
jgi:hypothetical protein